ncbi:hypothetical protein L484_008259 [Morus notabilis]|uniref:Uncharacterized protein n=1 Tax=Morus notabilis TaxID=981085 RepID=W9R478_9ROSA|nr:uncharacterized protein LOC21391630 [Morus notabilis]EXB55908.1 hypothetical protein L484_008259 [Morus notabilis]
MACLDMYNSEHKTNHHHHKHHHHPHFAAVSPRISFSNDFVDAQQALRQEMIRSSLRSDPPVSSDFEFSVTSNHSAMSGADELFFKGRLLPFKDNTTSSSSSSHRITTLREELLAVDDDDVTFRPPKGTTRWKSLLGLKRAHIGSNSKKAEKSEAHGGPGDGRRSGLVLHDQEAYFSKNSQELLNEGGSSACRDDVEIGI